MNIPSLLLSLCLFAPLAQAQEASPVIISRVDVNAQTSGWNGSAQILDNDPTQASENNHLAVQLEQIDADGKQTVILNPSLVTKQSPAGVEEPGENFNAKVSVQKTNGSLIISNWRDMGTSNWSTDYKIAYRDGKFLVAGIKYSYQYREDFGDCDLNFLTGQAIVNGKKVQVRAQKIEFAAATDDNTLQTCNRLLGI